MAREDPLGGGEDALALVAARPIAVGSLVRDDPKVVAAYLGVEDDEVAQVETEVGL